MDDFISTFFNIEILRQVSPLLIEGFWMTLKLAAVAIPLSLILGAAIAVAQDIQNRLLRALIVAYVDLMRAIPPLVLNGSSYFSEIFRAGLESVPNGQREAARSTGMSWAQSTLHVILPQGVRNVLPDLISNTVELAKQTSIASVVALQELLRSAQIAQGLTYNTTPLVVAALAYFIVFWPFVRMVSRLQNTPGAH